MTLCGGLTHHSPVTVTCLGSSRVLYPVSDFGPTSTHGAARGVFRTMQCCWQHCQTSRASAADLQCEHVLAAVVPDLEDAGLQSLHGALVDAALLHLKLHQQGHLQWEVKVILIN